MPIVLFFLLLLSMQIAFLPGLLTQGEKVSNPHKTIVVGGSSINAPYEFLDNDNEPDGYNVDLTRAIATETGVDVKIKLTRITRAKKDLINGKIDLLEGVMESYAEKNNFLFTPHTRVRQRVFTHDPGLPEIVSLAQLEGKKILVKKGGINHGFLIEHKTKAYVTPVNTKADALGQLASGKYDYAVISSISSRYIKRQLKFLNSLPQGKKIMEAGEIQPPLKYGFAAAPGNKKLMDKFSLGLRNLQDKRLQQEIQEQWLGEDLLANSHGEYPRLRIGNYIFTPLIFLICTVVLWNRSLKREVERRSKELALKQQQLIHADKMASLGTLVSGVAHEINNPTGLILYNLSVLEKICRAAESTLEERYHDSGDFFIGGMKYSLLRQESSAVFEEMKDGATRIKQIVDDLKDFARKDEAQLTERVNLNKVLGNAVRLIKTPIRRINCHIEVSYGDPIPKFLGSSRRIEQVIINLILNACQALDDPEKKVCVRTFFSEDNEIILEVKDEGVGIPANQLGHLTDPFYTTRRTQGGTGLGLSISANIMAEHKGSLKFHSKPGMGTTASMHLKASKRI